jgi:hypothetical protein
MMNKIIDGNTSRVNKKQSSKSMKQRKLMGGVESQKFKTFKGTKYKFMKYQFQLIECAY